MSNLILNLHSQRCWKCVPSCWGFPSCLAPLFFFLIVEFIMHCNLNYLMNKKCIWSRLWQHGLLCICALLSGKRDNSWLCCLGKALDLLCRLHSEVSKWCLVVRWKKNPKEQGESCPQILGVWCLWESRIYVTECAAFCSLAFPLRCQHVLAGHCCLTSWQPTWAWCLLRLCFGTRVEELWTAFTRLALIF